MQPSKTFMKNWQVYIVSMGERQHGNLDLITDGHHGMLSEVLGRYCTRKRTVLMLFFSFFD